MLYSFSNAAYPVEYVSCGNLVSQDGFLHDKRKMDTFVFIIVSEGVLHIEQNGHRYDVKENESLLLFPHQLHFGYKPSKGKLSYFWVHFYITDPGSLICSQTALLKNQAYQESIARSTPLSAPRDCFLLPEYGRLSLQKRSVILFVQLLDMAKRDHYQATLRCRYALNLLLLEFTHESFSVNNPAKSKIPRKVCQLTEWIHTHYDQNITVDSLAKQYHYHPTYLTALFKQYTGYPVSSYVNHIRITTAKNILCSKATLSIREVASMCGFQDEKYFMRVFKQLEGMTPSEYRNGFYEKMINTK